MRRSVKIVFMVNYPAKSIRAVCSAWLLAD